MKLNHGFTLVEVIVGIALLLILFLALLGVLRASLLLSAQTKAKAAAIELASSQMEYLRGLSYDAIGTEGGIPAGNIPQSATTTVDDTLYTVRTYISYYDDPADGTGADDTNGVTTDYKKGEVTVSYSINGLAKSVSLLSNFAPPTIESSTGGGTLSIHVVDASGTGVNDATVEIKNIETDPAIDFTTFSNTDGYVIVGGAATSSAYQIFVSKTGYSSAQTYARTTENVNPTPGYLTVAKDETTSATFAIDKLATLNIATLSPVSLSTMLDEFTSDSGLASATGTEVSGDALILSPNVINGTALSVPLTPSHLSGWGILNASPTTPAGTTLSVQVANASGVPLPDSVLPGNTSGFSTFPVSLTPIATSSYPSLSLLATLTSDSTSTTPSLENWSVTYSTGPLPRPSTGFTLTGEKTIGTDSSSSPIYKTVLTDTTNTSGTATENLEWDSYTPTLTGGYHLIEVCPSALDLAPGTTTSTTLLVGSAVGNTFSATVENTASSTVSGALVTLEKSDYALSVPTSVCGLAFFNDLPSGTYRAIVSAEGHATTTFENIAIPSATSTTFTLP